MNWIQKIVSLGLSAAVLAGSLPVRGFAAESCTHHPEHTAECGFIQAREEIPCGHVHGEECYAEVCTHTHGDCGYAEAVEAVACDCKGQLLKKTVHEDYCTFEEEAEQSECICIPEEVILGADHTDDCSYRPYEPEKPCTHDCAEGSCLEKKLFCTHEAHDAACGYAPAVKGKKCRFLCPECQAPEASQNGKVDPMASEEDHTAPRPVASTWGNANLIAPDTAFVSIDVEEDLSGVAMMRLDFRCGKHKLLSDDATLDYDEYNGYYNVLIHVPEGTEPGIYELYSVYLEDRAGNSCTYYRDPPTAKDTPFPDVFGGGSIVVRKPAQVEGDQVTGSWDENISWSLNLTTGEMVLSGTGDMEDNGLPYIPWIDFRLEIKTLTVEEGITSIYSWAFDECENLTSVSLPEGLLTIEGGAFGHCRSLTDIQIPDTVTTIGHQAFIFCDSLTEVTVPAGVHTIDFQPFGWCTNLQAIYVDPANPYFSNDEAGVLYDKDKTVLIQAPAKLAGSYTIADTTQTVMQRAFIECIQLTEVKIPGSVLDIEEEAFQGCYNMKSVSMAEGLVSVGNHAFAMCHALENVTFPSTLTTLGERAFYMCHAFTEVRIHENMETVGDGAFAMSESLEFIHVAEDNPNYCNDVYGVLYSKDMTELIQAPGQMAGQYRAEENTIAIKADAFYGCTNLTRLILPESVRSMGENAMQFCTALNEICFLGSAPYMGGGVFYQTAASAYYPYENETWTDSVLQDYGGDIRWMAFGKCGDSAYWAYGKANQELEITGAGSTYAYGSQDVPWAKWKDQIQTVSVKPGIIGLGERLFAGHKQLTSVSLPQYLGEIGEEAFYGCSKLTDIQIPSGVRYIDRNPFGLCSSLKSITVAEENAYYCSDDAGVLYNKDKTRLIQAPGAISGKFTVLGSVTSIVYDSFTHCGSLKQVVIPGNVESIGDNAFESCGGMDEVHFREDAPRIGSVAFLNTTTDAYYHADNQTWTKDVRKDYGGDITWRAYATEEPESEEEDVEEEELVNTVPNTLLVVTPQILEEALLEVLNHTEDYQHITMTDIFSGHVIFQFDKSQLIEGGATVELTVEDRNIDTVSLPVTALKTLVQKGASLSLITKNIRIILNNTALKAVVNQSAAASVYLHWREVNTNTLTNAQQKTLRQNILGEGGVRVGKVYSVSMYSGGRNITEFDGGVVTLKLPIPSGQKLENLVVCYLDQAGQLEEMETVQEKNHLSVYLTHLSEYAVVHKLSAESSAEPVPEETEQVPASEPESIPSPAPREIAQEDNLSSLYLWMMGLLLAAAGVCGVLLKKVLRKKKNR